MPDEQAARLTPEACERIRLETKPMFEALEREQQDREQRETIRLARERARLSQEDLTNLVYKSKRVRISQPKLSLYEQGRDVSLSPKEIRAIETVLVKALGREEPLLLTLIGPGLFDNALRNLLSGVEPSPAVDKQVARKQLLQQAGISQSALAKELGIYRSKIVEWINGRVELTSDEQKKLDRVLAEARHRKKESDPYFLLEKAYSLLDELWDEMKRSEERNKQQEELLDSYKELLSKVDDQNLRLRQIVMLPNAPAGELSEKAQAPPEIVKRTRLLN